MVDHINNRPPETAQVTINSEPNDADVPLELGVTARPGVRNGAVGSRLHFTELHLVTETEELQSEKLSKSWEVNYREAAIFLEEGANNEKLTSHPKSPEELSVYLLVHNNLYYCLDLVASVILLLLAFTEKPADILGLPVGVHGSIELTALMIIASELVMKLWWLGWHTFVRHTRSMFKATVLIIMLAEAVIVLVRQSSHFRVTRCLRPIFLIDNKFLGGIRRYLRQALQSVQPALDMLLLVMQAIFFFGVVGFLLFGSNPDDPYFNSWLNSFLSLFILLTSANYPDVMMPSYAATPIAAIFFVAYLLISMYFLLNVVLASVYAQFVNKEKEKFQKLLLHKRRAAQSAYRLLLSRSHRLGVALHHFCGLIRHMDPSIRYRDVLLMFRLLNKSKTGLVTQKEFFRIYEVVAFKWRLCVDPRVWFADVKWPFAAWILELNRRAVLHKYFENFICFVIFVQVLMYLKRFLHLHELPSTLTWDAQLFTFIYSLEVALKLLGLGWRRYFTSGWNLLDFSITTVSVIGIVAAHIFSVDLQFLVVVHLIRNVRLNKLRKFHRDVFGTAFLQLDRFVSAIAVFLFLYYAYAIVGMELFADYDLKNCCKNTSVESYYAFNVTGQSDGYFYLNNFESLINSYVTLFELTVVNNWFILMEGYAATVSDWSRLYFMIFYLNQMILMSIVVASIIDIYKFRMSYKEQMTKEEEIAEMEETVTLTAEEYDHVCRMECNAKQSKTTLKSLKQHLIRRVSTRRSTTEDPFRRLHETTEIDEAVGTERRPDVVFAGRRSRTKDALLAIMHKDDIELWVRQADVEDSVMARAAAAAAAPIAPVLVPEPPPVEDA